MADWWLEDLMGDLHVASFSVLTKKDCRSITPDAGWSKGLSWRMELEKGNLVYKLTDVLTNTIQGVLSMYDNDDHVFVDLIESSPHNRKSPRKFVNIARLLIAFAGQRSIDIGADGFIALTPKDGLYEYYVEQFRAYPVFGRNVGIADVVTKYWIKVYYK